MIGGAARIIDQQFLEYVELSLSVLARQFQSDAKQYRVIKIHARSDLIFGSPIIDSSGVHEKSAPVSPVFAIPA